MISDTLGTVFKINYTAVLKAVTQKAFLHGKIILVSVDFYVWEELKAFFKAKINYPSAVILHRYTVYDRVGRVV